MEVGRGVGVRSRALGRKASLGGDKITHVQRTNENLRRRAWRPQQPWKSTSSCSNLFKEMRKANEEFRGPVGKLREVQAPDWVRPEGGPWSGYRGLNHDIDLLFEKETPHLRQTRCGGPYDGFSYFSYFLQEISCALQ